MLDLRNYMVQIGEDLNKHVKSGNIMTPNGNLNFLIRTISYWISIKT